MASPSNPCRCHLNAQNRYFLCRRCRTPVLDPKNVYGLIIGDVHGTIGGNPYNVRTHAAIHRFIYDFPINNLRCNHCRKHIGVKFIVVGDNDPPVPRPYTLEGWVFFYFDRLLFWNGRQLIDADSDDLINLVMSLDGTELRFSISDPYLNEEINEGTGDEETETDDKTETDEETETENKTDDKIETDEGTETDEEESE